MRGLLGVLVVQKRVLAVLLMMLLGSGVTLQPATSLQAQDNTNALIRVCPQGGILPRPPDFQPGGIILTSFDSTSLWVYNVDNNSRYPLPDTAPCGTNCHLSRDARWITYYDPAGRVYGKMRLDGTQRTPLARYANEISWWTDDTLLIWTPAQQAYLRQEDQTETVPLNVNGVVSVQPGGYYGLMIEQAAENRFRRSLVNLENRDLEFMDDGRVDLGLVERYFTTAAWSPDGAWLAYTTPTLYDENAANEGTEVFAIRPGETESTQWTNLFSEYGAVRINGQAPGGSLSWSPDSRYLAFWVIELLGPDPEGDTGNAFIHLLDTETGRTRVYCGFSTTEHTPNPPRLIWSYDSTHIAFAGNIPADNQGYLLLALDIEAGTFTQLSAGIFPALGAADVVAWGLPPR